MLSPLDQNLVITGYVGPNQQPLIAQDLAERLKRRFVNIEQQIETRLGMPMDEVRLRYGEARLKTIENEVMGEVMLMRGVVLAISGETLMRSDYGNRVLEISTII